MSAALVRLKTEVCRTFGTASLSPTRSLSEHTYFPAASEHAHTETEATDENS